MKGLTDKELMRLCAYNAEHARGIVHTPEWTAQMAELQEKYSAARQREHEEAQQCKY
jgi:hypothetical protein